MNDLLTVENGNIMLAALLALSEVLALTPLRSNSIFQLAVGFINRLIGR